MQKQDNAASKLHSEIMERSGEDFYNCIQCGKCTAGCPLISAMDLLPREVLLYLQMGDEEKLVKLIKLVNEKSVCESC